MLRRYAFALHTDEAHPHIHLILKAVDEQGEQGEQGVRLNIKKATLRYWRSEFARNLRLLGVEANATERAVRGQGMKAKNDGIYRASLRGDSTYVRVQAVAVGAELPKANRHVEPGKRTIVAPRRTIESGWRTLADNVAKVGHQHLAREVQLFIERMPPQRLRKRSSPRDCRNALGLGNIRFLAEI